MINSVIWVSVNNTGIIIVQWLEHLTDVNSSLRSTPISELLFISNKFISDLKHVMGVLLNKGDFVNKIVS